MTMKMTRVKWMMTIEAVVTMMARGKKKSRILMTVMMMLMVMMMVITMKIARVKCTMTMVDVATSYNDCQWKEEAKDEEDDEDDDNDAHPSEVDDDHG